MSASMNQAFEATSELHPASRIEEKIVAMLEAALELEAGEIDVDVPFESYGLDSAEAVSLVGELEDWLGIELAPNLPYEYPTVSALAARLAGSTG